MSSPLPLVDHEGKSLSYEVNGDPARYGSFIEASNQEGIAVKVHLTPDAMAVLGRQLLQDSSPTPGAPTSPFLVPAVRANA